MLVAFESLVVAVGRYDSFEVFASLTCASCLEVLIKLVIRDLLAFFGSSPYYKIVCWMCSEKSTSVVQKANLKPFI